MVNNVNCADEVEWKKSCCNDDEEMRCVEEDKDMIDRSVTWNHKVLSAHIFRLTFKYGVML